MSTSTSATRLAVLLSLVALCGCVGTDRGDDRYAMAGRGLEEGVLLKRHAQTFVGSAPHCSRPATIDMGLVRAATPEAREIARDGVEPGTARHRQLEAKMHRRVVRVCAAVAQDASRDLVVRAGDVADARGHEVVDLTAAVVAALHAGG